MPETVFSVQNKKVKMVCECSKQIDCIHEQVAKADCECPLYRHTSRKRKYASAYLRFLCLAKREIGISFINVKADDVNSG